MRAALLDETGLLVSDVIEVDTSDDAVSLGGVVCPDFVNVGWAYDPVTGEFSIPSGSPIAPADGIAEPTTSSLLAVMKESYPTAPAKTFPVKVSADGDDHDNDVYGDAQISEAALVLVALATSAEMRAALAVPNAGAAPTLADAGFGTDFNVDLPSGWYSVTGTLDNGPAGTGAYIGVMLVIQRMFQSARSFQILLTAGAAWMRYGTLLSTTPSWGGWVKLAGLSDANTWSAVQDMGAGLKVGGGATVAKILTATASLDFPSIAAGSYQDLTITVAGAQINDSVALGLPSTVTAGLIFTAFVSAANTVKVRAANTTAAAIDPGAATVRATVFSF